MCCVCNAGPGLVLRDKSKDFLGKGQKSDAGEGGGIPVDSPQGTICKRPGI